MIQAGNNQLGLMYNHEKKGQYYFVLENKKDKVKETGCLVYSHITKTHRPIKL